MADTRAVAPAAPERSEPHAQRAPGITPFQPTGPYPQVMLDLPTGTAMPLSDAPRGERILIDGRLLDGNGKPIADAMIETWQADASGRYAHPRDPRGADADPDFWGYRRVASDSEGRFRIETIKPGAPHDRPQAPHLVVGIYGGGVLYRYVTRIYFEDEPANATDPILRVVPAHRRDTLIARHQEGVYRFEIRLQGENETVFFDV
jgi:protocatechuate 3,4-dioxygenase alpha subunit